MTALVLGSSVVPVAIGIVMALATMVLVFAFLMLSGDNRTRLEKRLTGFGVGDGTSDEDDPFAPREQQLAETRVLQDLVGVTGRLADRVGLLNRVEEKLEQADLPLRPPEALFFYLAGVVIIFLGGLLLLSAPVALVLTVLAAIGPAAWLELRRVRRLRKFEMQLPDVLNLLAGSMRAGFSFAQGLEAVAEEATEPSARELQRVFAESRLGRPIEDAMEDSANRMHSVDLLWAVMAIRIQREVGGNLAEILDTVAQTMTQRERLRHEILALTAEGRLSAWILGIFPPTFGLILYAVQPDYMKALFEHTIGIVALGVSAVMAIFGFFWLRKVMTIEV